MKHSARTLTALAAALLIPLGALATDPVAPAATKKTEPKCEQSSASRIRKNEADCAKSATPTTTYSKEDLDRTGQADTVEALRRLDPRFK